MADNYNYDMQRLQQDAIRRAREMQLRAQTATPPLNYPVPRPPASIPAPPPLNRPASNPPVPVQAAQQIQPPHEHHAGSHPPEHEPPKNQLSSINDIFESLLSDSERTLLLVLILLLVEEKADTGLIFALMYLAL